MDRINKKQWQLIKEIQVRVCEQLEISQETNEEAIKDRITSAVLNATACLDCNFDDKQVLITSVFNAMCRLGELQPLLDDDEVTEIMVNGPGNIFIEKRGEVKQLDMEIENEERLENMIQSIVAKVNRAVNEANPIVDARLDDGSRVNIILPPVALNGPILTIRKFPQNPLGMEHLIEGKTLTAEAGEFLGQLIKARYNIFICGGTNSGKTTFLNALSDFIPPDERIITIEDSAELQIHCIKNIVKMETRNANTEGKGVITMRDLIKTSLRMRPDRIIVGEVRGGEALDMLQAMNTGHDGSLSTGHGNSPADMLSRLETMVLMASSLPLAAVRKQMASALDIIVHLARLQDKSRHVMEITEVVGCDGEIILNPLFIYEEPENNEYTQGKLMKTGNKMIHLEKFKLYGVCHT